MCHTFTHLTLASVGTYTVAMIMQEDKSRRKMKKYKVERERLGCGGGGFELVDGHAGPAQLNLFNCVCRTTFQKKTRLNGAFSRKKCLKCENPIFFPPHFTDAVL